MDGFKDTTRTHYFKGGSVKGPKGAAKVAKVMHEFKSGNLKSSSGDKVTNPKQGIAIALSEARNAQKGKVKKAAGGPIRRPPTIDELNAANAATGGVDEPTMAKTVARGNRNQALEAADEGVMKAPPLQVRRRGVPVHSPEPLVNMGPRKTSP